MTAATTTGMYHVARRGDGWYVLDNDGLSIAVYSAGPVGASDAARHVEALNRAAARPGAETTLRSAQGIRAWRHAHGLTQTQLADLLEVRILTVQRWESGTTPVSRIVELALERLDQHLSH